MPSAWYQRRVDWHQPFESIYQVKFDGKKAGTSYFYAIYAFVYIYIWFRFFRRFKGVGIYWPSLMSLESWKIGDWQRMIYIVLIDLEFKPQTTCFLQILCALQWHWSRIDHWSQFFFKGHVFFCCLLKTEIHWCTIRDDENQTWLVLIWCFYTLTGHTIPSMARTV